MAKRCEICGKGPVVGRNISHAHNVTAAAVRAESPARAGARERRHPAAARLHPLPPVEQGRQGRLSGGRRPSRSMRQAVSTEAAPKAIGPYSQAIRAGALLFVSGQIPLDPATGVTRRWGHRRPDTPRLRQPQGHPRGWRRITRPRRPNDGLPCRHERLRRDERGLRDVLLVPGAGARNRPGRASARKTRASRSTSSRRCNVVRSGSRIALLLLRSGALDVQHTLDRPRSDLITFCRCFRSLISTVMSIRPRWSSTVASTLRMLVLMPAIFELTSARIPLRSSTWMLRRTV